MVTNECSPLFVKIYRKRNNWNVTKECILSYCMMCIKLTQTETGSVSSVKHANEGFTKNEI